MTSDEWAQRIFSADDLEELTFKAEKILYNSENGIIITLAITNDQSMEFCYHYNRSRAGKDSKFDSWSYIENFLLFLMHFLDEHLEEEGLDFNDFKD